MKNFKKNFIISFKEFGECADKSIIEIKTGNVSCQNQD